MKYEPNARLEHTLVVADYWHEQDALVVEHDMGCPVVQTRDESDLTGYGVEYDCAVAFEIFNASLESFFCHRDAPLAEPGAVALPPGRYLIEAWSSRFPEPPEPLREWEGGLRVVEFSVAAVGQDEGVMTSGGVP